MPRVRRDLVLQEVGDEGLLYDREGALVHILNATALFTWRQCDGTRSPEEIAAELKTAYSGTEKADVRGDVERILARFAERGLLEQTGS